MDKQQIISILKYLPGEIEVAKQGIIDEQKVLDIAKSTLAQKEEALMKSMTEGGMNAEEITVNLHDATRQERAKIVIAEHDVQAVKTRLNALNNELQAWQTALEILG